MDGIYSKDLHRENINRTRNTCLENICYIHVIKGGQINVRRKSPVYDHNTHANHVFIIIVIIYQPYRMNMANNYGN